MSPTSLGAGARSCARPLLVTSMTPPANPVPYLVVASEGERRRMVSISSAAMNLSSWSSLRVARSTTTRANAGPEAMLPTRAGSNQRRRRLSTTSQAVCPAASSSSARTMRFMFPRVAAAGVSTSPPKGVPGDEAQAETTRARTTECTAAETAQSSKECGSGAPNTREPPPRTRSP